MSRAELLDIIAKQQKEIETYENKIDESATKKMMTDGNLEHRDSNCEPGGEIHSRDSRDSKAIDENDITETKGNDNGKDTYTQCYLYYVYIMHVIILLK